VFVGNVPHHISDAELADYFCDVGEVLTVQIRGNDEAHYAFVEFAYPEQVENVLTLANQQPFMLEDVILRVQPRHGKSRHQVMHTVIVQLADTDQFQYDCICAQPHTCSLAHCHPYNAHV